MGVRMIDLIKANNLEVSHVNPNETEKLLKAKPSVSEKNLEARFKWLANNPGASWLVLKELDTIIGWAVLVDNRETLEPEYPDLKEFYMSPDYRNAQHQLFFIQGIKAMSIEDEYFNPAFQSHTAESSLAE